MFPPGCVRSAFCCATPAGSASASTSVALFGVTAINIIISISLYID